MDSGFILNPGKRGSRVHTSPALFRCHPNLDDEVNRNIVASEIEGGAFLDDLPARTTLQIQTQHPPSLLVFWGGGGGVDWGLPLLSLPPGCRNLKVLRGRVQFKIWFVGGAEFASPLPPPPSPSPLIPKMWKGEGEPPQPPPPTHKPPPNKKTPNYIPNTQ